MIWLVLYLATGLVIASNVAAAVWSERDILGPTFTAAVLVVSGILWPLTLGGLLTIHVLAKRVGSSSS